MSIPNKMAEDGLEPGAEKHAEIVSEKLAHHTTEENENTAWERQRLTQIRQENYMAIQKRIAMIEATDKKKKKTKTIIILIVIVIIAVLIINSGIAHSHNGELRNFATEQMNNRYTNVYADIVSMEPRYFIYTTSGSINMGITEVICECETVERKTIWVTIDIQEYPGGSAYNEESNKAYYYTISDPMRLNGSVTTAKNVIKTLEMSIGNVFVLDVDELQG